MPVVYMLECVDGSLYTGWTTDMNKRLQAHQQGTGARYTRSRLPVKLVYMEEVPDRKTALKREYALRKLKRSEKEMCVKEWKTKPPVFRRGVREE